MKALETRAHIHTQSQTPMYAQSHIRTLTILTWLKSLIKHTRNHILGHISNLRNSQTLKLTLQLHRTNQTGLHCCFFG